MDPMQGIAEGAIRPPDMFSGAPTQNVKVWLYKVEMFFKIRKVPADKEVMLATLMLDGAAAEWWVRYLSDMETGQVSKLETLKAFGEAITQQFRGSTNQRTARGRLDRLTQTGAIEEYNRTFNEITDAISDMTEAEKIHRYLSGLRARARLEVDYREPRNIREAQAIAVRYEEVFSSRGDSRQTSTRGRDDGEKRPDLYERPNDRQSSCYSCGKPGHVARRCPNPTVSRMSASGKEKPQ